MRSAILLETRSSRIDAAQFTLLLVYSSFLNVCVYCPVSTSWISLEPITKVPQAASRISSLWGLVTFRRLVQFTKTIVPEVTDSIGSVTVCYYLARSWDAAPAAAATSQDLRPAARAAAWPVTLKFHGFIVYTKNLLKPYAREKSH